MSSAIQSSCSSKFSLCGRITAPGVRFTAPSRCRLRHVATLAVLEAAGSRHVNTNHLGSCIFVCNIHYRQPTLQAKLSRHSIILGVHFVTRERIHVDRISTAWAIRRFVDPAATFEFVPRTADVTALAGIPFDVRGAELGHHRGRCTLEALIDRYELRDEALRRMSRIVRAADLPP